MKKVILIAITVCAAFLNCKKDEGPSGLSSLVNIVPFAAGTQCPGGGVTIETGLDANRNHILDPSEVTDSQSVCNGAAGANGHASLVTTSSLPANTICTGGGLEIQTGIDMNDDGILQASEVQQTQQLCNGTNGNYDKQVAILISGLGGGLGSGGTTPYIPGTQTVNFNIDNFPGVDSAVFVVNGAGVYSNNAKLNVKLYDITDGTAFNNSLVTATNSISNPITVYSSNILADLPKKNISLGIQIFMDNDGTNGDFLNSYLVLYRK